MSASLSTSLYRPTCVLVFCLSLIHMNSLQRDERFVQLYTHVDLSWYLSAFSTSVSEWGSRRPPTGQAGEISPFESSSFRLLSVLSVSKCLLSRWRKTLRKRENEKSTTHSTSSRHFPFIALCRRLSSFIITKKPKDGMSFWRENRPTNGDAFEPCLVGEETPI